MERLLIVGSGDVARRAMPWLRARFRVFALVRSDEAADAWRGLGACPVRGDLDAPASLARIARLAQALVLCAPPPGEGADDPRMRRLLARLGAGRAPRRVVYVSSSGVYGDCAGALVSETRPVAPATARARRRVAAETRLRAFAIRSGCALRILRAPGIYAAGRLSLERLRRGDPVLRAEEDVFTNHVHADDLARALGLALFRGPRLRVFNACDDSHLRMGDYYDAMADLAGLARPPRLARTACAQRLGPQSLSFMDESRRLLNTRIRRELRWLPRFADVRDGLAAALLPEGQ
ncbi:MAG: NAD(P)H-binding protein [Candidatus Dactylopiibacterium sp.]|nr:NAD(P)H-binding protein [Candidatus Dactylopiibacterium sp.]